MAKKTAKKAQEIEQVSQAPPQLTEEEKKRIEKIMKDVHKKVEKFQKEAVDKFKDYILGVSILPPEKKGQEEIQVLALVDDSDSKKMSKKELRDKIGGILTKLGEKDKIKPSVLLLTEMWQACFDGNYQHLQTIAMSSIVFDKGILGACKIAEVHKRMVLEKFDKYIVSYVAAGGLFSGKGNEKSDIDVFMIIDDTDVKKMTRVELIERLRAIVYQMSFDAAQMTGVKRQFHIQTYLLTDFWDIIKDSASPVIFTFLRDGVPFYDRGIYAPWKNLLDMGRIKPSKEAIRKFNMSGDQFYDAAKKKLLRIGVEDLYYAVLNPAQSALMMKGFAPPTHKETGRLVREVFVEKEKVLEPKYADILDKMIGNFKKWEYGELKELSGKEVEKMLQEADLFRKRIGKLFKQIETQSDKDTIVLVYDQTLAAARESIAISGGDKEVAEKKVLSEFKKQLVETGKIPEGLYNKLERVFDAKKDFDGDKLKKSDIETAHRESRLFIRSMIEFLQRSQLQERESKTLRVKHEKGFADIVVLEDMIYVVHDNDVHSAELKAGKPGKFEESSQDKMQEDIKSKRKIATLSSAVLDSLKEHFNSSLELMV
jgi:uncharacterized protein (UPF0332 family)